jgi:hypothetical protein
MATEDSMRIALAALALMLTACGQSASAPAPVDVAPASAATSIEPQIFTLENEAVVGLWSFDRTCGLYDLAIYADATVDYFDYSDEGNVVSYSGEWTEEPENQRVALSLRRLDAEGHVTGDPIEYVLDLITPPVDDLNGGFGRADGTWRTDLHAKRCPQEDRE